MSTLGFVGLGAMGASIAGRLLSQGHTVYGTNRTRSKAEPLIEAGLLWCDSPREVAHAADVVFSMVTDDGALDALTAGPGGILAGLAAGKVYVDMSTVGPQFSRALGERVNSRGASMLAAPVSGSVPAAQSGTLAIIVGGDVSRQLAGDYIKACLESQREHALAEREHGRRADTSGGRAIEGVGGDTGAGQDTQPLSEKEIEVGKERAREEDRRLRDETIAANQRLGAALIKHLGKVKVDERVLKILTAAPLAGDLGSIAARGARLSFPGWAELSTRKNGSTKAEYPHYLQAEAKARDFLLGASTATEIAGRTLALLAAARWAKEDHAVARSHASNYTLRFTSFVERGVPWRAEAEDLLDEILIEKLPPEVADPIREAKERRAAQRAEEERRERERATVVAAFIEKAPSLTCDERHSEIQRLRREYGFSALPREQGRKLMELPEATEPAVAEEPGAQSVSQGDGEPQPQADVALAA